MIEILKKKLMKEIEEETNDNEEEGNDYVDSDEEDKEFKIGKN